MSSTTFARLTGIGVNANMIARFSPLDSARKFAESFNDVRQVVQGCDGKFWVVSSKDAGKLRKAGYETI